MSRDTHLDGLKFILIFLVILGHLHVQYPVGRLIAFHMPMFVLLSGYFTKVTNGAKLAKWLRKTFAIYLIFIGFNYILDAIVTQGFPSMAEAIKSLYMPPLAMWYLLCLMEWRVVVFVFKKCRWSPGWKMFAATIFFALAVGFVPLGHEFSFQRAFALFPFFILGMMIRENNWMERIRQLDIRVALVMLLLGLGLSLLTSAYMPKFPYKSLLGLGIRAFQTANALMLCIAILRLTCHDFIKWFAPLGAMTLFFYLYHILFVRSLEAVYPEFSTNVLEAFLLTTVIIGIIWMMIRLRFFRWPMLQS